MGFKFVMLHLEESHEQFGNRTRVEILGSILKVAGSGTLKTHIMYKANLSYEMLQRYLKMLLEAGLVEGSTFDGYYRASPKGVTFVRDYEDFKRVGELYESKKSSLLEIIAKA